ncbi:thiamine-phosphate kinase [Sphingomonas arenae]|uniref:thiamine-phosphate kinase n=1 Tax=Sphingomonas arenae TaxID=2812555 RepID=UPI001967BAA1|nr:thiamine-phosphate kinase [Sphingomonas arenae]
MTTEHQIIERLRSIATDPGARGLLDDVAVIGDLVLTHDTIAEGVHYLPDDPPASVGWKLVAVNLSDLAAKGAEPVAALLSLTLTGAEGWTEAFLGGVAAACESYGLPLLGGDTISLPGGAPRVLGLTAIGRSAKAPPRTGGRVGDRLWLVGTLGDSAAGLALLRVSKHADGPLVDTYRRPIPLLAAGRALAPLASAMMDISDGLLLDLQRLCRASGCGAEVDLGALPLSPAFTAARGRDRTARLFAATGGDDYALLAAVPPEVSLSLPGETRVACIGALAPGSILSLTDASGSVPLPEQLGHEHRTS